MIFEVTPLKKKIVLTGGGSAGHVMVNLALIPRLMERGWQITYIGSTNGIEKELLSEIKGVKYYGISTGKLRRYFDWKNFKDPFKVLKGVFQATQIIRNEKPNLVFSKGGFVSVPVIIGSKLNGIPSIIHESDISPGLANKISIPFASKVCITFPETKQHLPSAKTEFIGAIVRDELKQGDATRGYHFTDLTKTKPVILVMGGSLGAKKINEVIRNNLKELLHHYHIVHLCGKGHIDDTIKQFGYKQYEYVNKELSDILAMAHLIISRAGANAIHEFLELKKPMILIPLTRQASRGDQILNAESFKKSGYCEVIEEEKLTSETLMATIKQVSNHSERYIANMKNNEKDSPLNKLLKLIDKTSKGK